MDADCPPVLAAELDGALDEAERAFADLDIEGFIARSDAIRARVPCLAEVPPVPVVARLHRMEGLRRFGERDVDAVRAFAAARALDPGYLLPPEIAPEGSPILADYVAMDLSAGTTVPMPPPIAGTIFVDGRESRDRPAAWPALVQQVVGGTPAWTAWLPEDAPIAYEAVAEPDPEPVPTAAATPPRRSSRVPLLVATAASAVGSGVVYGVGAGTRARYFDPATPDTELPGLKARTNALAVGATAGGVVTVGLAATLAITW